MSYRTQPETLNVPNCTDKYSKTNNAIGRRVTFPIGTEHIKLHERTKKNMERK